MPRLDRTGPNGEGPKTGLGRGNYNTTNTGDSNQKTSFFGKFGRWFKGKMGGRGMGGRGMGGRGMGGRGMGGRGMGGRGMGGRGMGGK